MLNGGLETFHLGSWGCYLEECLVILIGLKKGLGLSRPSATSHAVGPYNLAMCSLLNRITVKVIVSCISSKELPNYWIGGESITYNVLDIVLNALQVSSPLIPIKFSGAGYYWLNSTEVHDFFWYEIGFCIQHHDTVSWTPVFKNLAF